MKRTFVIMIFALTELSLIKCNQIYKAGNLVYLGYPIETQLRTEIVSRYVDTLIKNHGYSVPNKWANERKLIDLDSVDNKRIYFKDEPEEMYLLSYGGQLTLSDVYNEKIKKGDWVAQRDSMPPSEEKRIKQRFKKEILDIVEAMAKDDNLPDSIIYKKAF